MSFLPAFRTGFGPWAPVKEPTVRFKITEERLEYDTHYWGTAEPGVQYSTLEDAVQALERLTAIRPDEAFRIERRIGCGDYHPLPVT